VGFESIYFFGGCGKENRKAGQHRKKKKEASIDEWNPHIIENSGCVRPWIRSSDVTMVEPDS